MRILQIASGAPVSSGDPCTLAMHGLSRALVELGHSVQVVHGSDDTSSSASDMPYPVVHIPSLHWPARRRTWLGDGISQALFGLAAVVELLGRDPYAWDVICFHATTPALLPIKMARIRGVATLFRYQNPLLTQAEDAEAGRFDYSALGLPTIAGICSQLMESSVLADANKIAVASQYAQQRITERFALSPTKVSVVRNGVDTRRFHPTPRPFELMQRYGVCDAAKVVMCVARIAPYKNQLALIKAIPGILEEVPATVFFFVGPVSDPAYFATIQDFIAKNALGRRVVFTGAVDPGLVPKYHCLADVFVLPSLAEGMPLVLLEAMSCGRATVASSLPQHMEVAEHGEAMLLVDPRSEQSLAETVAEVLTNDSLRRRLQRTARELALEAYDWKAVAGSMLHACEEACQLRSQAGS
jgi:glycosyltransferase involved in cell wall biosynthesis